MLSGERCVGVGGPPGNRRIAKGELVLVDISPRRAGYWGDSCVTICTGTPTRAMIKLHDTALRALELGTRACRPGITAGELDRLVRVYMEDAGFTYPHHSGHAVGVGSLWKPRIVRGVTMRLEEGVVIALEPGSYRDSIGIRVEHLVVVRPGGGEVIRDYSLDLT